MIRLWIKEVQDLSRATWRIMSELSSNPGLYADKAHALNHRVTLLSIWGEWTYFLLDSLFNYLTCERLEKRNYLLFPEFSQLLNKRGEPRTCRCQSLVSIFLGISKDTQMANVPWKPHDRVSLQWAWCQVKPLIIGQRWETTAYVCQALSSLHEGLFLHSI